MFHLSANTDMIDVLPDCLPVASRQAKRGHASREQIQAVAHILLRGEFMATEYKVTEYHFPNCTVRVHDPIRTPEQQIQRQKNLEEAVAVFMTEVYKKREEQQKNESETQII